MGKLPKEIRDKFKRWGRKGGLLGGRKRTDAMTPEQRSELAKKAAEARWANAKAKGGAKGER
jgi:hypothetical protein